MKNCCQPRRQAADLSRPAVPCRPLIFNSLRTAPLLQPLSFQQLTTVNLATPVFSIQYNSGGTPPHHFGFEKPSRRKFDKKRVKSRMKAIPPNAARKTRFGKTEIGSGFGLETSNARDKHSTREEARNRNKESVKPEKYWIERGHSLVSHYE